MGKLKDKIRKPAVEIVKADVKPDGVSDKEAIMALVGAVKEVGVDAAQAAIKMGKYDLIKFGEMELKGFNDLMSSLPCKHRKGTAIGNMTCAARASLGLNAEVTVEMCKNGCALRTTS